MNSDQRHCDSMKSLFESLNFRSSFFIKLNNIKGYIITIEKINKKILRNTFYNIGVAISHTTFFERSNQGFPMYGITIFNIILNKNSQENTFCKHLILMEDSIESFTQKITVTQFVSISYIRMFLLKETCLCNQF